MGAKSSAQAPAQPAPEPPAAEDEPRPYQVDTPQQLQKYIEGAMAYLNSDGAAVPCEVCGSFHDNCRGHLRDFCNAKHKRDWYDQRIQKLKDVSSDILGHWQDLDADFVMLHAGLAGAALPPFQILRAQVQAKMKEEATMYSRALQQLPQSDLQAIKAFDALWPPGLPEDVKELAIQPEEATTMRLNYATGVRTLDLLFVFAGHLAEAAGLGTRSLDLSVKRPTRMRNKAVFRFPQESARNDFRHSTDVYRVSIFAESLQQIAKMMSILECLGRETFGRTQPLEILKLSHMREHFVVERMKNRFVEPSPGGYPDVLVNLRINGYVYELQLHHRGLFELRGDAGRNLAKWFDHFPAGREGYGNFAAQAGAQGEANAANNSATGEVKRLAGGRYTGEEKNGERHGHGTFYYNSGDRYEGQWQNGKKQGTGTYHYNSGDRYVGTFQDDRMHGKGKFINTGGETYEGEFREGMRHGTGKWWALDGNVQEGTWWRNKRVEIISM